MPDKQADIKSRIVEHLQRVTRNKIVLARTSIADVKYVDIGRKLSEALYDHSDDRRVAMRANTELKKILTASITDHPDYGKVIAIKNIGILFEPMLKLSFANFLSQNSRNNLLIVEWKGEITDNAIYFLTQRDGVKIDISHLNPITIEN